MSARENNVIAYPSRSDELIPDGIYQVALERYELASRYKRGSLELWFKVLDYGEHFGRLVPRYYRVELVGSSTLPVLLIREAADPKIG